MTNKNVKCQIRCLYCKKWFGSPIQFGSNKTYSSSKLIGNTVTYPNCNKSTGCNKENIRFKERDNQGKVAIYEGKDVSD